jgi:hypothetical protein
MEKVDDEIPDEEQRNIDDERQHILRLLPVNLL